MCPSTFISIQNISSASTADHSASSVKHREIQHGIESKFLFIKVQKSKPGDGNFLTKIPSDNMMIGSFPLPVSIISENDRNVPSSSKIISLKNFDVT